MTQMSMQEYQSNPAVSRGFLVDLLRSPAHAKHNRENRKDATLAMNLGTALHTKVLEPELFESQFLVAKIDRRTTAGKELDAKAKADNLIVLDPDDGKEIDEMVASIKAHAGAKKLLVNGKPEVSLFSKLDGIDIKARLDYIRNDGIILDLKTTNDASPDSFMKSIINFDYHTQAAFYLDIASSLGLPAIHFAFIAVEKDAPYAVGVYTLTDDFIELGRTRYKRALEIYKTCIETNKWPAYSDSIIELNPPAWAISKEKNSNE